MHAPKCSYREKPTPPPYPYPLFYGTEETRDLVFRLNFPHALPCPPLPCPPLPCDFWMPTCLLQEKEKEKKVNWQMFTSTIAQRDASTFMMAG